MELIKQKQIEPLTPGDIPVEVRDKNYIHEQRFGTDLWEIQHNLSKYPNVTTYGSNEEQIIGDVTHVDNMNLQIKYNVPCQGIAILN